MGVVFKVKGKESRFLLWFAVFFMAGQALHYVLYPVIGPVFIHRLEAEVVSKLINTLSPAERTTVSENTVMSGPYSIQIVKGCEGSEGMILLAAGLCAFPMPLKRKAFGAALGCGMVYLANLARMVGLYYALKYQPLAFDFSHVYLGQVFIILVALVFFLLWVARFGRMPDGREKVA